MIPILGATSPGQKTFGQQTVGQHVIKRLAAQLSVWQDLLGQ